MTRMIAALAGLMLSALPLSAADILVLEIGGATSGTVEIELASETAPKHAAQITALAEAGAYNDVVFHRVINGFMAQTGDVAHGTRTAFPQGRAGFGGSDLPDIPAEFSDAAFEEGVVGMARSRNPNSANSQFFIMLAPAPHLNGQYTVIGKVIAGMETVHAIRKGNSAQNGAVSDPDYIMTATIRSE